MIGRFWHRAPWGMAVIAAALALFDVQFSVAGRMVTLAAMVIALAGVLAAPLADAMLIGIAASLFPGDAALFGVTLALLYRVIRIGGLRFSGSLRSLLLFGFFISAIASAVFGLITIGARPLQWFVWMVTLGAPLLLLGAACPRLPDQIAPLLSRFLLFVLWLQVPICIVQLIRHGEPEPGDWFAGTWGNANLVGLWGAATLSVCVVRLLTRTAALDGRRAWMMGCANVVASTFLVWGASAKLYSACIFGAAGLVIVMLMVVGTDLSRLRTVRRSSMAILVILLTGVLAQSWVRDNFEGLVSNWENSEKRILLTRVFFELGQRYNSILGVGPGMLGSRAASAASADILYKETEGPFASLLGPAPEPERWAMYGLWDAEVAQEITNKSAILTMPFSGWASLRAELGWPAVVALAFYFVSLARQMAIIAARHPGARGIGIAAAVGCVALVPMLFFDNILEQPHFIGPLAILVIASRGVAADLDRRAKASAVVRATELETPADHLHPHALRA